MDAADVHDAEVDPTKYRLRALGWDPGNQPGPVDVDGNMDVGEDDGIGAPSTWIPESGSRRRQGALPAPDSPSLSVRLPAPKGSVGRHPDPGSSFDRLCEPSQALEVNRTLYDEMTWDQLHDKCSQRGFRNKESKAVLKTRLTKMGAGD